MNYDYGMQHKLWPSYIYTMFDAPVLNQFKFDNVFHVDKLLILNSSFVRAFYSFEDIEIISFPYLIFYLCLKCHLIFSRNMHMTSQARYQVLLPSKWILIPFHIISYSYSISIHWESSPRIAHQWRQLIGVCKYTMIYMHSARKGHRHDIIYNISLT